MQEEGLCAGSGVLVWQDPTRLAASSTMWSAVSAVGGFVAECLQWNIFPPFPRILILPSSRGHISSKFHNMAPQCLVCHWEPGLCPEQWDLDPRPGGCLPWGLQLSLGAAAPPGSCCSCILQDSLHFLLANLLLRQPPLQLLILCIKHSLSNPFPFKLMYGFSLLNGPWLMYCGFIDFYFSWCYFSWILKYFSVPPILSSPILGL